MELPGDGRGPSLGDRRYSDPIVYSSPSTDINEDGITTPVVDQAEPGSLQATPEVPPSNLIRDNTRTTMVANRTEPYSIEVLIEAHERVMSLIEGARSGIHDRTLELEDLATRLTNQRHLIALERERYQAVWHILYKYIFEHQDGDGDWFEPWFMLTEATERAVACIYALKRLEGQHAAARRELVQLEKYVEILHKCQEKL